jgi:four helix bundle protein
MPNRSELLQRRLVAFGASANELVRRIPRDLAGQNVARQLVRSATAPAALYAEAREAESTHDYIHKMKLCLKELRESGVWIAMLHSTSGGTIHPQRLERECDQLTAIVVACIRKARSHEEGAQTPPAPRSSVS